MEVVHGYCACWSDAWLIWKPVSALGTSSAVCRRLLSIVTQVQEVQRWDGAAQRLLPGEDELLYGRAGYLYCLLFLHKQIDPMADAAPMVSTVPILVPCETLLSVQLLSDSESCILQPWQSWSLQVAIRAPCARLYLAFGQLFRPVMPELRLFHCAGIVCRCTTWCSRLCLTDSAIHLQRSMEDSCTHGTAVHILEVSCGGAVLRTIDPGSFEQVQ